jgi:NAD(P)-dependent dehydrogenase (short-subunit alcohol dehydrogenase family)
MARSYAGGTAVVTGAASGIGLGIARALARHGMNLVLADIQAQALDAAASDVERLGVRAVAVPTDVSDAASVEALARRAVDAFGKVHVVVNNAGVAFHGTEVADIGLGDWAWVIGVNLYGVIHGIRSFVPLIRSHGEPGHVLNTASVAGFRVSPGLKHGAYAMTKHGVVALTEALQFELEGTNVAVSMLCPGAVNSNLDGSARLRPERFGGAHERPQQHFLREFMEEGLTPDQAGERAVEGILAEEFVIFTGTASRPWVEGRQRLVSEAFDRIEGRALAPNARR